jgi:Na+/H+ antiporter NhaC
MKIILLSFFLLLASFSFSQIHDFGISASATIMGERDADVVILIFSPEGEVDTSINKSIQFILNGENKILDFSEGKTILKYPVTYSHRLSVYPNGQPEMEKQHEFRQVPLWLSIVPPLIAIALALIFKEVLISLFIGIFSGILILTGFYPSDWLKAIFAFADTYLIAALTDPDRMAVLVFSFLIGAMVNLVIKNGGMEGIISKLRKWAESPRRSQFITWLSGILIFFDDYANTLIVGNTMRPLTDKHRVSREKLAYIVDSTAAPITSIAFITTWIGAELGYIKGAIDTIGLDESAYSIFINSLRYSYYPVLSLFLVLMVIVLRKDFGAMLKVEKLARAGNYDYTRHTGKEEITENKVDKRYSFQWIFAIIPVFILIAGAFAALIYSGYDEATWADAETSIFVKLSQTIGDADPYKALLWASISSLAAAFLLTIGFRVMKLGNSVETMVDGVKMMLGAILILIFAWVLADLTKELNTAEFLTNLLRGNINPYFLPLMAFIIAGLVSFSTGSSWGTMAILYPILLPLSYQLSIESGLDAGTTMEIFYHVTSVILAGAVFGDHCSPISDTTILSSLASSCNHIDHVRTQLPYALLVAGVSILLGHLLLSFFPLHWLLEFILCFAVLTGLLLLLGRNPEVR